MDNSVEAELDPPFEVLEPLDYRGPVVFNSPHSGRVYPRTFLSAAKLDLATLRRSEDSFVDELIAGVVPRGHPLVRVHFPRCYVDVNREPYELDPRMFDGRLPSFANTRSMRVAGGPRDSRARGRRCTGNLPPAHPDRRCAAPHRGALQAVPPRAAAAAHPRASRFRRGGAGRLPLDALNGRHQGRPAARRCRARRPLRHELRADRLGSDRGDVPRARLRGEPQQALRGRLHHRALRQSGRRPAFDPDRDQSRALHGRAALRALRRRSTGSPATSACWRTGSGRFRSEELKPYRAAAE